MNNKLIKLIDEFGEQMGKNTGNWLLLADCKTEIERLERQLEATERSLEDTTAALNRLESMREYVPMTEHDWLALWKLSNVFNYALNIESEVVKRAGLIVKEKNNGH